MCGRGMSIDKYLTILFFVSLIAVYLGILLNESKRLFVRFEGLRDPVCFERIPILIFSNYYDKQCSYPGVCRRLGRISISSCGRNLSIILESNCGVFLKEGLEVEDSVIVDRRDSLYIYYINFVENETDCDKIYIRCEHPFFIKPTKYPEDFHFGNYTYERCQGETIREYFLFENGMLLKVREV